MSFLSDIHNALRMSRVTGKGRSTIPAERIPTGTHKEYPRMPRIVLPPPTQLTSSLSEVLEQRHSYSHLHSWAPLSLAEIGTLLGSSLSVHAGSTKRRYPSGGGLFPIETYLCGPLIEGYPRACFHYHPRAHALEHLWDTDSFTFRDYFSESVPEGTGCVLFTAVWDRTSAKYGDLGYLHSLIETGHMAQNVLLAATALNIAARPIAGFNDDALHSLLNLDPSEEQAVYAITLAGINARHE